MAPDLVLLLVVVGSIVFLILLVATGAAISSMES